MTGGRPEDVDVLEECPIGGKEPEGEECGQSRPVEAAARRRRSHRRETRSESSSRSAPRKVSVDGSEPIRPGVPAPVGLAPTEQQKVSVEPLRETVVAGQLAEERPGVVTGRKRQVAEQPEGPGPALERPEREAPPARAPGREPHAARVAPGTQVRKPRRRQRSAIAERDQPVPAESGRAGHRAPRLSLEGLCHACSAFAHAAFPARRGWRSPS